MLLFLLTALWVWQIGRIPNEWARCLLPLVRDHKVKIEGKCKFAPQVLGIMDSIILSVRYVMFNAKWQVACHCTGIILTLLLHCMKDLDKLIH